MKKLIYLLLLVSFVSCKTDEPKAFVINPNAMISIKPAVGAWTSLQNVKSNTGHLSALEIVKKANSIQFYNISKYGNQSVSAGFGENQRDTTSNPPVLKMWGTYIINPTTVELVTDFIEASDCVIINVTNTGTPTNIIEHVDTIAYIPNSVVRTAESQIKTAFEAKNTDEVYRIFNNAFTFTPITGAEWRALKVLNQQ